MTNQAPPPPSSGYNAAPQPLSPADEKLWATLVHIGGIFLSFLPALIGYLLLKDRGPFVRDHTRVALNFQISIAIYTIALSVVGGVLVLVTLGIAAVIVIPVAVAFSIAIVVFMIIAAVKANAGQYYRYPLTIEFIR